MCTPRLFSTWRGAVSSAGAMSSYEVLAKAAQRVGIDARGVEVIRDGSNTVYRWPMALSRGSASRAALRSRVSRWLNNSGIPTVQPISTVVKPIVVDDRPVRWWHLIPDLRSSTPEELGTVLRALGALPIPAELMLVLYDPLVGLSERLSAAATPASGPDPAVR